MVNMRKKQEQSTNDFNLSKLNIAIIVLLLLHNSRQAISQYDDLSLLFKLFVIILGVSYV